VARFQVGFAVAVLEGLFGTERESFTEALRQSWRPGATATRYGRTWFLSKPRRRIGTVWTGRIGFLQEDQLTAVFWDEEEADFSHRATTSGVVIPFALNIATGFVGFQLLSGLVRPTSFTGAMQSLLNQDPLHRWSVEPLAINRTYEEWRSHVAVLTDFSFRLEVPNPHYVNEPDVEHLLEDLRVQVAKLVGRARSGESINDEADIFRQSLDHVRRKYGRGVLKGRDDAGIDTEWDSSKGGIVPLRRRVESAGEGEIEDDDLIRTLSEEEGRLDDLVRGEPEDDDAAR
jgi:hypothetical protein